MGLNQVGASIADVVSGMNAFSGILSLLSRASTNRGQHVDIHARRAWLYTMQVHG